MKQFVLLLSFVLFVSCTFAQPPSEKLFKKYGDKEGIDVSIHSEQLAVDSSTNTPITSVIKTLTVENDDEEKHRSKLFKQLVNECKKLLENKNYAVLQHEKDEDELTKICKYAKNGTVEICILELDEDELTLTTTIITGLSEKAMKDFKFNNTKH